MDAVIRTISEKDGVSVARIIRHVMPEFGAGGKGFAIHDREVDDMYSAYQGEAAEYYVCEIGKIVVGGGGIGPLAGGPSDICELKKMYFLPEARGRGLGQRLLAACLNAARKMGYKKVYVETFNTMTAAMKLYEKNGFQPIARPLGSTGHFACDRFYLLDITA